MFAHSTPCASVCQALSTIIFLTERPLYQLGAEQEKEIKSLLLSSAELNGLSIPLCISFVGRKY